MTEKIKSLADQIREQIRNETAGTTESAQLPDTDPGSSELEQDNKKKKKSGTIKAVSSVHTDAEILLFFSALDNFTYKGSQKSLIRVDTKTMNLLKRLKLAKGIDMNKFIVYSLHWFISQHPWLPSHIQETLKNSDI